MTKKSKKKAARRVLTRPKIKIIRVENPEDGDKEFGGCARVEFLYTPDKNHRDDEIEDAKFQGIDPPPETRSEVREVRFYIDCDDVDGAGYAATKVFAAWLRAGAE